MANTHPSVIASIDGDDVAITTVKHHSPYAAEVYLMAVKPTHHRCGIGTAMLRQLDSPTDSDPSKSSREELIARWDAWIRMPDCTRPGGRRRQEAGRTRVPREARTTLGRRAAARQAFATIDQLEAERNAMVTKALSWLLRALTARHRNEAVEYLAQHEQSLPRVAVRETRTKLRTGTKSGR